MIPLRDSTPSGTVPIATIGLIAINSVVWLYEVSLGPELNRFVFEYGLIPLRFVTAGRYEGGVWSNAIVPLMSSMFMHGGWMHVIGNMWFLWIFGDNIEDRLGHVKFILFYILCGIGAAILHIVFDPASKLPMVGASGAISGVLGAYLISYPRARVLTLFIIFVLIRFVEIPAYVFLIFWFFFQLLAGTAQYGAGQEVGGVAYWAHMGGFVVGIALLWIFPKRPPRPNFMARF
ncbi:MAG: rhomboid family intramembrane serine protease [Thermodesulfobacteriota bacterium]